MLANGSNYESILRNAKLDTPETLKIVESCPIAYRGQVAKNLVMLSEYGLIHDDNTGAIVKAGQSSTSLTFGLIRLYESKLLNDEHRRFLSICNELATEAAETLIILDKQGLLSDEIFSKIKTHPEAIGTLRNACTTLQASDLRFADYATVLLEHIAHSECLIDAILKLREHQLLVDDSEDDAASHMGHESSGFLAQSPKIDWNTLLMTALCTHPAHALGLAEAYIQLSHNKCLTVDIYRELNRSPAHAKALADYYNRIRKYTLITPKILLAISADITLAKELYKALDTLYYEDLITSENVKFLIVDWENGEEDKPALTAEYADKIAICITILHKSGQMTKCLKEILREYPDYSNVILKTLRYFRNKGQLSLEKPGWLNEYIIEQIQIVKSLEKIKAANIFGEHIIDRFERYPAFTMKFVLCLDLPDSLEILQNNEYKKDFTNAVISLIRESIDLELPLSVLIRHPEKAISIAQAMILLNRFKLLDKKMIESLIQYARHIDKILAYLIQSQDAQASMSPLMLEHQFLVFDQEDDSSDEEDVRTNWSDLDLSDPDIFDEVTFESDTESELDEDDRHLEQSALSLNEAGIQVTEVLLTYLSECVDVVIPLTDSLLRITQIVPWDDRLLDKINGELRLAELLEQGLIMLRECGQVSWYANILIEHPECAVPLAHCIQLLQSYQLLQPDHPEFFAKNAAIGSTLWAFLSMKKDQGTPEEGIHQLSYFDLLNSEAVHDLNEEMIELFNALYRLEQQIGCLPEGLSQLLRSHPSHRIEIVKALINISALVPISHRVLDNIDEHPEHAQMMATSLDIFADCGQLATYHVLTVQYPQCAVELAECIRLLENNELLKDSHQTFFAKYGVIGKALWLFLQQKNEATSLLQGESELRFFEVLAPEVTSISSFEPNSIVRAVDSLVLLDECIITLSDKTLASFRANPIQAEFIASALIEHAYSHGIAHPDITAGNQRLKQHQLFNESTKALLAAHPEHAQNIAESLLQIAQHIPIHGYLLRAIDGEPDSMNEIAHGLNILAQSHLLEEKYYLLLLQYPHSAQPLAECLCLLHQNQQLTPEHFQVLRECGALAEAILMLLSNENSSGNFGESVIKLQYFAFLKDTKRWKENTPITLSVIDAMMFVEQNACPITQAIADMLQNTPVQARLLATLLTQISKRIPITDYLLEKIDGRVNSTDMIERCLNVLDALDILDKFHDLPLLGLDCATELIDSVAILNGVVEMTPEFIDFFRRNRDYGKAVHRLLSDKQQENTLEQGIELLVVFDSLEQKTKEELARKPEQATQLIAGFGKLFESRQLTYSTFKLLESVPTITIQYAEALNGVASDSDSDQDSDALTEYDPRSFMGLDSDEDSEMEAFEFHLDNDNRPGV